MTQARITVCGSCGAKNRIPEEKSPAEARCGRCKTPLVSGRPIEVDEATLRKMIAASDLPVLVDFWAPWCGPCRSMAPQLERAAAQLTPDVPVVKLNTDQAQNLAAELRIQSIPTLALFGGGREIARTSGTMDADSLVRWVRAHENG